MEGADDLLPAPWIGAVCVEVAGSIARGDAPCQGSQYATVRVRVGGRASSKNAKVDEGMGRDIENRSTARNDAPTNQDALHIDSYIKVLGEFLASCDTPMTVAIQGDWGSGKTSLMGMVKADLENERCKVITFNTWQYSQFQMGDDLVLALMEHLIESIGQGDESDAYEVRARRAGLRSALRSIVGAVGNTALDEFGKVVPFGTVAVKAGREMVRSGIDAYGDEKNAAFQAPVYRGRTASIEGLRASLEDYVKAALAEDGRYERFVIMIDDLDRLPPGRAVEVMEALKIFLDVQRCVYVLAIDFDVVKEGVRHKFGDQFDERKAVAFFDKIIQVPFHMPLAAYKVDGFLLESLSLGRDVELEAGNQYVELAKSSVGTNPRSLKRLANTFHLLRGLDLAGGQSDGSGVSVPPLHLFASLCMQSAMPLYYRDFVARILPLLGEGVEDQQAKLSDFIDQQVAGFTPVTTTFESGTTSSSAGRDADSVNGDADAPGSRDRELRGGTLGSQYGLSDPEAAGFAGFIDSFRQIFAADPDSQDDLNAASLDLALRRAAVTSVGGNGGKGDQGTAMTYGPEAVFGRLREMGIAGAIPLATLDVLINALGKRLPSEHFDVGLSSDGKRVSLYVDGTAHTRGTMAEIAMGKTVLSVRFAAKYLPQDTVDRWKAAAEAHFDIAENPTVGFQLVLKRIRTMTPEQLDVLVGWLIESHALTRQKFFGSSDR